jgi:hypothetical protein
MVGGCPGTLASFTTKTGRHDIAEILLKVPSTTAWDHTSDPSSKSAMCPNGILAVGCIPIGFVVILIMGHYYKFLSKHSSNPQHYLITDNPI